MKASIISLKYKYTVHERATEPTVFYAYEELPCCESQRELFDNCNTEILIASIFCHLHSFPIHSFIHVEHIISTD